METRRTAQIIATVAERLPKAILSQLVDRLATLDEHSSSSERMAVSYTISQGDAREMVADLIRCWNEEEPDLPPKSLALAFQSASEVDEHHRNREEVQLIWTGPDVSSLHAKCAVIDSNLLFLSSANLTEFAFNLNMELGVLIKGGSLPARQLRPIFIR
jgi:PLD-like domain